jgi:hypothetical protein
MTSIAHRRRGADRSLRPTSRQHPRAPAVSTDAPVRAGSGGLRPVLIDNSPEREFEDIQPGRPDEIEGEDEQAREPPPGEREDT